MSKNYKAVAFFSDKCMIPGLHAAIISLLNSLSREKCDDLHIYIFMDGVSRKDKQLIYKTHALNHKNTTLKIYDFTPEAPQGSNSLYGNNTVYGRLYLPDLLNEFNECIYLDCDIIVNRCIYELFDEFDKNNILFVDGVLIRKQSVDAKLFQMANLDMDGLSFNSGVMGINLDLWRLHKISEKCELIAMKYRGNFISADQALLNVALHDSFKSVGKTWNIHIYPYTKKIERLEKGIYHFVGTPKPWDLFGSLTHLNYFHWETYCKLSSFMKISRFKYSSFKRSVVSTKKLVKYAIQRRYK